MCIQPRGLVVRNCRIRCKMYAAHTTFFKKDIDIVILWAYNITKIIRNAGKDGLYLHRGDNSVELSLHFLISCSFLKPTSLTLRQWLRGNAYGEDIRYFYTNLRVVGSNLARRNLPFYLCFYFLFFSNIYLLMLFNIHVNKISIFIMDIITSYIYLSVQC